MAFHEMIDRNDIFLVEGQKGSGKLAFALWAIKANAKEPNVTLLTPLKKRLAVRKIEGLIELSGEMEIFRETLDLFSFKSEFSRILNAYTYHNLLEDIGRILETTSGPLVLHRLDVWFDFHDRDNIEPFLKQLIELCSGMGKKLFITVINESSQYQIIQEVLRDDIDLHLKLETGSATSREMTVAYSLHHLNEYRYIFTKEENRLVLHSASEMNNRTTSKARVVLLSTDPYTQDLHRYLLQDRNDIRLEIVESLSGAMQAILSGPEVVIYHSEASDIDFSPCKVIADHKLSTKMIVINQKNFIRAEDKADAINMGCEDIAGIGGNLSSYMLNIERVLKKTFYPRDIGKLEGAPENGHDAAAFLAWSDFYLLHNVFFSLFVLTCTSEEDIAKIPLRDYDRLYCDRKGGTLYLLMPHMQKDEFAILKEKFKRKELELEVLKSADALDLDFGRVKLKVENGTIRYS
jgi:hypothetical protein